jgi:hypothetical protein
MSLIDDLIRRENKLRTGEREFRFIRELDTDTRRRLEVAQRLDGGELKQAPDDTGLYFDQAGRGWRIVPEEHRSVAALAVVDGREVALAPGPSRKEYEAERRKREREAEAAAKARRAWLREGRQPVTLAAVEERQLPTLRQAYDRIVGAEGLLEVRGGGRLVVAVSLSGDGPYGRAGLADCCRVLYAAERFVVEWLEAGAKAPLPDVPITPAGAPVE